MTSWGFTEEEFDATLQSVLVSTDTESDLVGSPFRIDEFLTSLPTKRRRTSNDGYLSESRNNNSYGKDNHAVNIQIKEGSDEPEANTSYPENKWIKYDSFEKILQDCLRKHKNDSDDIQVKNEKPEFDDDFFNYILEITQTDERGSPTSVGSTQTTTSTTTINASSNPVEMLCQLNDTSLVTPCDKAGDNKVLNDSLNPPVKVNFLDEKDISTAKETKEDNMEVLLSEIDSFFEEFAETRAAFEYCGNEARTDSVKTLLSPPKELQQQNANQKHEARPKIRVIVKDLFIPSNNNAPFTQKRAKMLYRFPNNNIPVQYQSLETLIVMLQRKIHDIHAFQRRSTLKINHGKDSDNFTDDLLEAMDSEVGMRKLQRSQQMLSQETVTFSPKIVRQSTLKCSGNSRTPETADSHLTRALEDIVSDGSLLCDPDYCEWQVPTEITDRTVMQKILDIFNNILNDTRRDRHPSFHIRNQRDWSNAIFQNNRLMLKCEKAAKIAVVGCNRLQSRRRFEHIVWILAKIVDLVILNQSVTKRELYYQMREYFKNLALYQTDSCVHTVSGILDLAPWDFRIFATSKGLVYGDLIVTFSNGDVLVCSVIGGAAIPQRVNDIIKVETNAAFILVIEKDAIFHELMKQNLPNKLGCSLIMVTGKGYADMSTRMFIKKIWQTASIPVFVLVDCDPYGIEIMLNYRFGSLAQAHLADQLVLPEIRWLGVFPSEIITMNIKRQPLTDRDKSKIEHILQRPYIDGIPTLKNELDILLRKGFKANIEGTVKGNTFLRDCYLYVKLRDKNFL